MRLIERIFVHCTASSQKWGVKELWDEFKRKGWKNPGYHYVITKDGAVHQMLPIEMISNGVKGYNSTAINIAYVGGIDSKGKTVDNRTKEQKDSLVTLLKQLKKKYPNVKLYVDEAHSFFALHELGLSRALNLDADVDFILVTLSKALGGSGAVFLCNDEIRQILINSARSLIFSTAIPSIDVAWTHFVLSKDFSARRQILHDSIRFLELSDSQICPFIVGENEDALLLSRKLLQQGFFVPAIRPPTVPLHTARLRISLRGDITPEELASLKEILDAYKAAHAG